MNTLEAIATRKSTRAYRPEQISEEALDTILKAASAAPIAMAKYDMLHITVIQSEEMIARINDLSADFFFKRTGMKKNMDFGAKTVIFVSTDPTAIDQACIDLVYAAKDDPGLPHFLERIESLNGVHTIEAAAALGLGSREYELVEV